MQKSKNFSTCVPLCIYLEILVQVQQVMEYDCNAHLGFAWDTPQRQSHLLRILHLQQVQLLQTFPVLEIHRSR